MKSPLRQFMIISIVGMTLTILSLLYFHIGLSDHYFEEHLDSHNQSLAIALRNTLLQNDLEEALIDGSENMSASMITKFASVLEDGLRWLPVVKVKIYSRDSIVLFSSKSSEIGDNAQQNNAVQQALTGIAVSGRVHPNDRNEFDNVIEFEDLHQHYIPIESSKSGKIIGVFETYMKMSNVASDIQAKQSSIFWLITVLLAIFYLALAITFLRTHRLLQVETQRRQAHLRELKAMHANLEQRVVERTAELDQAKTFLQSVIDGIAIPVLVIRPDFSIALMNEKAKSLIPPDQDEANYKYCYQVSHRKSSFCLQPEQPCPLTKVMEHGGSEMVRHTHYDADNNPIIVDLLITPLYSAKGEFLGVVEVQHDVTQMVQMQAGLEESRSRLLATMDSVPDAIFNCNSEWVIRSCNQSAQGMFNGKESELVDIDFTNFFTEDDMVNALSSETPVRQQTILKPVHGKEFPAELWIGLLEDPHGKTSYIVVVHDITSRIKTQLELETTRQKYFHQDKMAAIGQLAAGILHEVGNPIIADFASPKPRERDLLDLNGLLRSVTGLLTYDPRFSSIGVELQLDKNLPAIVGVADQLTQVFMNLLINAMDACSSLGRGKNNIVLKTEFDGDRVHISVKDFGCGMSNETLEHAREAFFTTKSVGQGTGLGLPLCDTIISEHEGEFIIESEEGKGTLVHVYLPVDLAAEETDKIEADNDLEEN